MAYGYLPTSYKALQESVSSIYKSMVPSSLKGIGEINPEQKQQTENLKWQQEMFHRILNMIGLHREGIVSEKQVIATRSELLDTLIASPAEGECPAITRDKLLFLQELLYAKCISEEDYHLSKRPLLLRLAVQGAEIDSRDVVLRGPPSAIKGVSHVAEPCASREPEMNWSVVEFKEDQSLLKSAEDSPAKRKSPIKQVIHAMSRFSISPYKGGRSNHKDKPPRPSVIIPQSLEFLNSQENPFWQVAGLIEESDKRSSEESALLEPQGRITTGAKVKVRKVFHQLFQRVQTDHSRESHSEIPHDDSGSSSGSDSEDQEAKLSNRPKLWGLHLLGSWKKPSSGEEADSYLPLAGGSEEPLSPSKLVLKPQGGGPNTRKIKKKLHSNGAPTDFFIDKVLGENIKSELSRIRSELDTTTNPSPNFTNEQIEAVATRLPVDKNELKKFFPKSWCDRYGDIVLDVVRTEFKNHVGEMENLHKAAREKRKKASTQGLFQDENCSPNCYAPETRQKSTATKVGVGGGGGGGIASHNTTVLTSPLTEQQPRSPAAFRPVPKSPSSLINEAHSQACPVNPNSPSLHLRSVSNQCEPSSPFLQETPYKPVARSLNKEMDMDGND